MGDTIVQIIAQQEAAGATCLCRYAATKKLREACESFSEAWTNVLVRCFSDTPP